MSAGTKTKGKAENPGVSLRGHLCVRRIRSLVLTQKTGFKSRACQSESRIELPPQQAIPVRQEWIRSQEFSALTAQDTIFKVIWTLKCLGIQHWSSWEEVTISRPHIINTDNYLREKKKQHKIKDKHIRKEEPEEITDSIKRLVMKIDATIINYKTTLLTVFKKIKGKTWNYLLTNRRLHRVI